MANSPSAKKRARQSDKHRQHNMGLRSMVRTSIKKVLRAIESANSTEAQKEYVSAVKIIDRMADKGLIHKNKAARHKSRLNARVKKLSVA